MNVNCTALTLTSCCWSSLNVNELLLGNPIVVMLLMLNTKNTVNPLTFTSSTHASDEYAIEERARIVFRICNVFDHGRNGTDHGIGDWCTVHIKNKIP